MVKPTVALDAMGGDFAPVETVAGALLAARKLHATILLVGPTALLTKQIAAMGHKVTESRVVLDSSCAGEISIVDASDSIGMDEKAVRSIRSKPNSSIAVASRLVKEGAAQGIVSAGNTGAVASAALLTFGRTKGVSRPAIAVPLPSAKNPVVLIDAGANAECRPEHLLHFGIIGSIYSEEVLGICNPRVAILSIGEEPGKGNDLVQKATALLEGCDLNFIGNVEGRDIPMGNADVVVCDGFTGNIVLKTMEGTAAMVAGALKKKLLSSLRSKLGALILKKDLAAFKEDLNPEKYGGAHLLGVNGICVITHGSSSRQAIEASLRVAVTALEHDLVDKLKDGLKRAASVATPKAADDTTEGTQEASSTTTGGGT